MWFNKSLNLIIFKILISKIWANKIMLFIIRFMLIKLKNNCKVCKENNYTVLVCGKLKMFNKIYLNQSSFFLLN